jgi:hypothetical protein
METPYGEYLKEKILQSENRNDKRISLYMIRSKTTNMIGLVESESIELIYYKDLELKELPLFPDMLNISEKPKEQRKP